MNAYSPIRTGDGDVDRNLDLIRASLDGAKQDIDLRGTYKQVVVPMAAYTIPASARGDFAALILPPGTWDLTGVFQEFNNGAITATEFDLGISTTPGNSSIGLSYAVNQASVATTTLTGGFYNAPLVVPNYRVSHGVPTTYYLKTIVFISITNVFAAGRLSAVQVA